MIRMTPSEYMIGFILVLLTVGWLDTFDEFSLSCSKRQGYILTHAGNEFCVRHTAVLDSKMKRR